MRILISIIILLSTAISTPLFAQRPIFSIGPMIHINLPYGPAPMSFSWGVEAAVWYPLEKSLHGVDFGFDVERNKFRLYAEYQQTLPEITLIGFSAGPCIQVEKNKPVSIGAQGSLWGNVYLGVDARIRYIAGDAFTFAPGLYFKLPFYNGNIILPVGAH